MAVLRTGQITDFSNQGTEYSVDELQTDGSYEKFTYYTPQFTKYHGYYRQIPELRAVINKLASWTFGRGIKADKKNKEKLKRLKGIGKDTARSLFKNQWRTALVCGDSFAHIIKDNQGRVTNIKPLNPQDIRIVSDEYGMLVGYKLREVEKTYGLDEIFHLSYERIANEVHGIPFIEALETLILSRNEALDDLRILYHRNIKPIQFFEVETEDDSKLNEIETTINDAYKKSENVVIPAGVVREIKRSSTAQYGNLDSLPYIKFLVRQFVSSCGMPEVVMGWGSDTTEASSKVIVTSYEQEVWDMKLYNEEQAEAQLNIKYNIEPAPSLMDELKKDEKKDSNYQTKNKINTVAKDTQ